VLRRLFLLLFGLCFFFGPALGCTGIAQKENDYRYRLSVIDELVGKAYEPTRTELRAKKEAIEAEYVALPASAGKRVGPLVELSKRLDALIAHYRPLIDTPKPTTEQHRTSLIVAMAGRWHGGGVELTVGMDGALTYRKTAGDGGVESFTGKVARVTDHWFEAVNDADGGPPRKFWVNKRPERDNGVWRMTLDRVVMTGVRAS
jgi:hypothetical protein